MKTHITKARKLTQQGGRAAEGEVVTAISSIDKAVSKGVIHRNKGARLKSRLMKELNQSPSEEGVNIDY
jgi:small subunit ribosomal protein S20